MLLADWIDIVTPSTPEKGRAALSNVETIMRSARLSSQVSARLALQEIAKTWTDGGDVELKAMGKDMLAALYKIRPEASRKLYQRIIRQSAEYFGFRNKMTVDESLGEMLAEVEAYSESPNDTSGVDKSVFVTALEGEVAGLRATLYGLGHEISELRAQLRESEESTRGTAIAALFGEMNSPINGNLLDNLMQGGFLIANLLQNGWVPQPEIESVPYLLKMFSDYLSRAGVVRIKQVGERETIRLENLPQINYIGSEFTNEGEAKTVEYRTPGWRYGDSVITRPQAIEVKKIAGETQTMNAK